MTLKICPVMDSASTGIERGPGRALPPEGPIVSVNDFIRRLPAIINPTQLQWLRFQADPARRAHRRGLVTGAGKFFERYRLVDRFFGKVV